MDKEAERLVRHCMFSKTNTKSSSPLNEVIATQLTEELMDKFHVSERKRKQLRELQTEITSTVKFKEFKTRLQPLYQQVPRMNQSHKEIRTYADMGPSTEMSALVENSIKERVCARGLEKKYTKIIENIMADAKVEFVKITHEIGVSTFFLDQGVT